MGLTRAQKARKHGGTAAPPGPRRGTRLHQAGPGELRPEPTRSSSGLVVGVAMSVSAVLWLYVHAWVLPQFGAAAAGGLALPEWMPGGFDQEHAQRLATALGEQGRAQYEAVHRSSGLLAPLFVGLAWLLFVAVNTASRARRWVRSAVVLGFAAVSLAGNAAIDAALADPADGSAVTLASVLVIARWVLLVLLLAVTATVAVEAVRRRSRAAPADAPPRE
ncbi:hypothetical protein [uncultured Kocuria sp.]|uniref:hypothetical protein n=1 Tax=uncultured Kocuria sp. TaxID=259305 RepID=UPI00261206DA|nr:hypothetical protein [uncultured Kocuria sp.]